MVCLTKKQVMDLRIMISLSCNRVDMVGCFCSTLLLHLQQSDFLIALQQFSALFQLLWLAISCAMVSFEYQDSSICFLVLILHQDCSVSLFEVLSSTTLNLCQILQFRLILVLINDMRSLKNLLNKDWMSPLSVTFLRAFS